MNSDKAWSWLDIAGLVVFIITLAFFLDTVLGRIDYPYDLEWMEGGMLIHALRIQQGDGLYVPPSADFIPYIYPPLYPWLLAKLSMVGGVDYWLGRGVSLMGTLLALGALVTGLRKESVSWGVSFAAGALFLSTYEDAGTFFDLTRADALMIGFLGWSVVLARHRVLWAAGVLCWLAFLAKHNAAIVGVPIALWLLRDHGVKDALSFGAWSAIPALLSIAVLQYQTDGLFLTYLLDVPAHHPIVGYRFAWLSELEMATAVAVPLLLWSFSHGTKLWQWSRVRGGLWVALTVTAGWMAQADVSIFPKIAGSAKNGIIPFAVLLWVTGVGLHWSKATITRFMTPEPNRSSTDYWLAMWVTLVFFSALMRGHHGGFTNVLMPGLWVLCLVLPLALHQSNLPKWVVLLSIIAQVWWGRWEPESLKPTAADRLAGDELVEKLRVEKGPVWSPHAPWLPVQAGHPPTTHLIALWDIDHKSGPLVDDVDAIKEDVANHRWSVIVSADKRLGFGVKNHYQRAETIRPRGGAFVPKVGWKVKPSYMYRPKIIVPSKGEAIPNAGQEKSTTQ